MCKYKTTKKAFIESISLFGFTSLIASIFYSFAMDSSLIHSDDPYIIGFSLATVNAIGAFIYLSLKETKLKWLKSLNSLAIYYCLIIAYCLFIEYIGGEASGYGYFFLRNIFFSSLLLFIFINYSINRKAVYTGFLSGLIYFFGFLYVLFNIT